MARAKMFCNGKNQDGSSCKNWAIKGSYYCQMHQSQVTKNDIEQMQSTQNWSALIIFLIIAVIFLISLAGGCEKEFFRWISH